MNKPPSNPAARQVASNSYETLLAEIKQRVPLLESVPTLPSAVN